MLIILGLILGTLLHLVYSESFRFSDRGFFLLILPPIIFSAGYTLKKKLFLRNLHYISLFGLLGTLLSFLLLTLLLSLANLYFQLLSQTDCLLLVLINFNLYRRLCSVLLIP